MRPDSHREQVPEKRCGNCKFSEYIRQKRDLLCFYNDKIKVVKWNWKDSPDDIKRDIYVDGEEVGSMEEEYDKVWGGRIVEYTDICNEWEHE